MTKRFGDRKIRGCVALPAFGHDASLFRSWFHNRFFCHYIFLSNSVISVACLFSGRRAWRLASLLFVVFLTAGCADPTTGVVTGTITVDGAPAKTGSIAFFPVNGKSSTAGAEIIDGKYTATVPLGAAKVEIRVSKVVGQKKLYDTPDSPIKPIMAESLPAKYNDATELSLDVRPGENRQDYDLATK
jgi:hypothetical protein